MIQALLMKSDPGVVTIEHEARFQDGSLHWQQWVNRTILDADGQVIELQGIGRDITERKRAEEGLRASEERYRALVESQTEMLCRYLPDTTLTFVNDAFCRCYGRPREELIGRRFLDDLSDEAARDHHVQYTAALLMHPHTAVDEHEVVLPDGSIGWQQWVDHAIYDSQGDVLEIQAIGRDITDLKRAEAALRESEARFRAAFESATVGMALVGLDGHPLEVNYALVEMLGYSEQEVRAHAFADFTVPEDVEPNLRLFRQAVAGDLEHYHVETRYLHKDGHLVWGHVSAGIVRDAVGKPLYLVTHMQDITERKQAEQALRESEARYRAVVSNFPQGSILLFGEDLRHSFADGPGLQAAGLTRMGVEGKTVWQAFPPDVAGALEPSYRAALDGRSVSFDLAHDQQIYSFQVVPILHSATRQGMVILQEVTEQRCARDELEHERTRAALLRALSQEFRTLAEHSPDLIARFDREGRFVYVNQAGADQLGLPAEQWVGKTFADLGIRQDVYMPWAQALRVVVQTGALRTFDIEAQAPSGQVRFLHVRFVPEFSDNDGALLSVLGIATDVSALKQAEARLAEQASELEAIFEAQADGVGVYDLQGHFVRANRALRDLLGFDADDDYTSRPLEERAQRLLLFDEQGQVLASEQWPHWRVLRGEILAGASAMEARVRTVDGRELWTSITGAPVRRPDGQVIGTVLITRDVTARRALERQVAEQASQLQAIFDAIADGVVVYDRDGHVVRTNRAWQDLFRRYVELTGLSSDPAFAALPFAKQIERWAELERMGQALLRDASGSAMPLEETPISRALRGETVTGANAVDKGVEGPDGRVYETSISAAPIRDMEGTIVGAVAVAREVTAQRQLERQVREQASQLEAVFAAMTDGVFVLDAKGHVSRLNAAAHTLFGPAPGNGLTNTAEGRAQSLDLRDANGRPLPLEQLPTQRVLGGEVLAGDDAVTLYVRTHDGRERTISLTGGPLRDAATGQIVGAVGVVRDVTELQRVQTALAEQERLFRTLVEHSPDIIARFDRELRYLYVSPAIRQVSPLPETGYRGKTNAELGWPEAAYAPAHRAIEQVFQTGQPETLEESEAALHNPAAPRYFRAQVLPECADDGRVESVLTVTTDITALKRTEHALREANASLEAARQEEIRRKQIAESLRDVLSVLNSARPPREVLQYIVGQVEELLGSAAAVIYGPDDFADSMALGVSGVSGVSGAPPTLLRVQAARGLRLGGRRPRPHQRLPFADPAVEQVLESAQSVAVVDDRRAPPSNGAGDEADGHVTVGQVTIPRLHGILPAPYHALQVLPIRVHDGIYGCLLLFYIEPRRFLAEEVALAQAYADQVAQAVTNARLQAHREREAATAEREHLARELHDTVTQEIYSASLLAEAIPKLWKLHHTEAEAALEELHGITAGALAGLRALLLELRPAALEQSPLSEALRRLGAAMTNRAGVPIVVDVEGATGIEPLLPAAVKVAFYRVAQESLMNATKFAKAHAIRLRLRFQGTSQLELEIADDGQGFDPRAVPAGHFGVAIMWERARNIGASIQVRSQAGRGTVVVMTWRSSRKAFAPERAEPRKAMAPGGITPGGIT
jgi:PAS domain S-box-containing protein